jgi:hypothetical protein
MQTSTSIHATQTTATKRYKQQQPGKTNDMQTSTSIHATQTTGNQAIQTKEKKGNQAKQTTGKQATHDSKFVLHGCCCLSRLVACCFAWLLLFVLPFVYFVWLLLFVLFVCCCLLCFTIACLHDGSLDCVHSNRDLHTDTHTDCNHR